MPDQPQQPPPAAEPDYASEIRIAFLVAGQVLQSLNTARQRCEMRCSPLLVLSALEDAGRMVAALGEAMTRAHAVAWREAQPALGLADPAPAAPFRPLPPLPDVPTELG